MIPEYREITKEELNTYEDLILPMVYDELTDAEDMDTEYISIACHIGEEPAGVIIAEPEGNGDLNLLSIWTAPKFRRMGVASSLMDKMLTVALHPYDWEESQYGDDIVLKTMYCLEKEYQEPFEAWLRDVSFTDFCILKKKAGRSPEVCSATAEVHFSRYEALEDKTT